MVTKRQRSKWEALMGKTQYSSASEIMKRENHVSYRLKEILRFDEDKPQQEEGYETREETMP